jgi:adenylate cyclase
VARVVERLLQQDPAARYRSANELLTELQALREGAAVSAPTVSAGPAAPSARMPQSRRVRVGIAVAVIAASALGVVLWRQASGHQDARTVVAAETKQGPASLAVLPLANYSGDPAQEYFADGMTDELTTTLTKIEALRVIAHRSVLRFKRSDRSVPEIARSLGVSHVVDGSVLQDGGRVRITATLIDAATNTPIWVESFERERRDVMALQREVALAIAREIEITLTPQDRARLADAPKVDPEAFDLYVKGTQARYRLTSDAFREAAGYFERAVAEDSTYAPAYAGLASTYALSGDESRARRFADKALALNPDLAEPHMVLGMVRQFFDWDWAGAEDAFRDGIKLNPGYAEAHHELSMLLMRRRRFDEAMSEAQRTLYLAPTSARFQVGVAEVYLYSGRYREALSAAEKAGAIDSNLASSYLVKGMAYGHLGEYAKAEAALERCIELSPDEACHAELGYVYAVSGKRAEALKLLEALKPDPGSKQEFRIIKSRSIAEIYTGLGDREQALTWLERRVEHGQGVYLAIHPAFRSLHGEPRFRALLTKLRLDDVMP